MHQKQNQKKLNEKELWRKVQEFRTMSFRSLRTWSPEEMSSIQVCWQQSSDINITNSTTETKSKWTKQGKQTGLCKEEAVLWTTCLPHHVHLMFPHSNNKRKLIGGRTNSGRYHFFFRRGSDQGESIYWKDFTRQISHIQIHRQQSIHYNGGGVFEDTTNISDSKTAKSLGNQNAKSKSTKEKQW